MKKAIWSIIIILVILVSFVLYTMITTGYFRKIEGSFEQLIVQKIRISGPEDIDVSRSEGFLIISSDDRAAHRDQRQAAPCGLYLYDISTSSLQYLDIEMPHELHPHGIDMVEIDSGVYRILVVNHVGHEGRAYTLAGTHINHYIEEIWLEEGRLKWIRSWESPLIKSPNDVLIIDEDRFYFTNDHGSDTDWGLWCEDYLGWRRSGVVYYDGIDFREVAHGVAYANGIATDRERSLLYVASPRDFLIKVYQILEGGRLAFVEDIACGTGVDNIEMDVDGTLWVGCHPSLLHFSAYAQGQQAVAPSEIIHVTYRSSGDYVIRRIAEDDGRQMSAATVAIPYGDHLYLGNVMDEHIVILNHSAR